MRSSKSIRGVLSILCICVPAQQVSSQSPAQSRRIVIAASTVLDGKGGLLHSTRVVIEGSQIVAIDSKPVLWITRERIFSTSSTTLISARPSTTSVLLYSANRLRCWERRSEAAARTAASIRCTKSADRARCNWL